MKSRFSQLIERSRTGIIFAAVVLGMIFFHDLSRHLLLWLVAFFGSYEYLRLRGSNAFSGIKLWLLAALAGPLFSVLNYFGGFGFYPLLPVLLLSVLYQSYLAGRLFIKYGYTQKSYSSVIQAFLYVGLPVLLLNQVLRDAPGEDLLIVLIAVIWASDTFAYLIGSLIGKHKLLPSVSPGKTVEGAIGGAVFALLTGWILHAFWPLGSLTFQLGLSALIWLTGLAGDLVESHLKRYYGAKDSGSWLPGHGGVLDRFDSFLFSLPFVLLYTVLF